MISWMTSDESRAAGRASLSSPTLLTGRSATRCCTVSRYSSSLYGASRKRSLFSFQASTRIGSKTTSTPSPKDTQQLSDDKVSHHILFC